MTILELVLSIVVLPMSGALAVFIFQSRDRGRQIAEVKAQANREAADWRSELDALRAMYYSLDQRAREAIADQRYEIQVYDCGARVDNPDMRWRWQVWDADRVLRSILEADQAGSPVIPVMLGNCPTDYEAEAEAIKWVMANGGSLVVRGAVTQ